VERDIREAEEKRDEYYLQEFMIGPSLSVQVRSIGHDIVILGVTRQLVGESWLHAPDFRYCGNIGPLTDPSHYDCFLHAFRLSHLGRIQGLWGFDFVFTDGVPSLLEVNPRYTAAMELVEWSTRRSVFDDGITNSQTGPIIGKAIYYAEHSFQFPAEGPWEASLIHCTDVWRRPDYADIPAAGLPIEKGQPVLTILAEGVNEDEVLNALKSRAADLDKLFT
jgi:predicted ATP-grasp superfamily ATP-dependent carboligase